MTGRARAALALVALALVALAPVFSRARADDASSPRRLFLDAVEAEVRDHAWERAASLYERVLAERDIPDDLHARAEVRRARCKKRLEEAASPPPPVGPGPAATSEGSPEDAFVDATRAFVERVASFPFASSVPISEAGKIPCSLGSVRDATGRSKDTAALRERLEAALFGTDALELVGKVASPDPAFVVCPELAPAAGGVVARIALVSVETLEPLLAVEARSPRPAATPAPAPAPIAPVFSASVHQPFARQSCPSCHVPSERMPRGQRAPEAWTHCLECHEELGPGKLAPDGKPRHHPIRVACDPARIKPGRALRLEDGKLECVTCHQHHESRFPRLLKDYDTSGASPQALCLRCHDR